MFLQAVSGEIYDPKENCSIKVGIILDSGSQRSYITQSLANKLRLKSISTQEMEIKTFGDTSKQVTVCSEYEFCLKGTSGERVYMRGFDVPVICAPLNKQPYDEAKYVFP